jgi:CTP synthase
LFAGLVKAALDHQKGGDLLPVANGAETKSAEVTSAEAPAGAGGSARKVSAK